MNKQPTAVREGGPVEPSTAMAANGIGFLTLFAARDNLAPVYAGTEPYAEVQRRRARNKRARAARRIARLRSS